ncbi:hypothetical protein F3Y22_tig00005856pilonHSYRG00111 [Hibiscus syriacus]|uniref:Uncharacterized protein n=1 Tax=Hibiscus syriacus TaxID=106335 RepID=A0A6A3CER7_HIBSY|nr:hypothetical protein F3Y22_tig00005856pilonHSYRG00111 [Hibiscus syriacus]
MAVIVGFVWCFIPVQVASQAWCSANAGGGVDKVPTRESPLCNIRLLELVRELDVPGLYVNALNEIEVLGKDNEGNKKFMEDAGVARAVILLLILSTFGVSKVPVRSGGRGFLGSGGGFYSHHRCGHQTGPKRGFRGGAARAAAAARGPRVSYPRVSIWSHLDRWILPDPTVSLRRLARGGWHGIRVRKP